LKSHEHTETFLWQQLKQGDVDALGRLYDQFIEELFEYGSQFYQDKQPVMDAIHDLFLNLYKYHKNLADTDNVKFYLYRSLKNQVLKSSSPVIHVPLINLSESIKAKFSNASCEDDIIATECLDERVLRLSTAVRDLSKTQRQGIFLRFNEDLRYEEIAEIMNVSVATSRTIIYRAIKSLRSNLTLLFLLVCFFI